MIRKIAVGCGGSILFFAILIVVAFALNWGSLRSRLVNLQQIFTELVESDVSTATGLIDYMGEEYQGVSFVSYYVLPNGEIDMTHPVMMQNEDQPMVLASTIKIAVLAAYADQVAAGSLDPAEQISISAWEKYYLPTSDGGAHTAALAELGIATNEAGFALDGTETVSLDQMAWAMIRYSDNAATDYLMDLVGTDRFTSVLEDQDIQGQTPYIPLLGMFLTWQNHEQAGITPDHIANLTNLSPDAYIAQAYAMQSKYIEDQTWRNAEIAWRQTQNIGLISDEAAVVSAVAPRGTAAGYAQIMAKVATDNFISPEVSAIMRKHLEWPMANAPVSSEFNDYGTKGGLLAKVITEASYMTPKSDENGQPQVVVLFMNDIPLAPWLQLMQNFVHQELMAGISNDEALREKMITHLENSP